jgi:ATP-dependent protease ClpP protease subunit
MEKHGQNSFTKQAYLRLLLIQIVLLPAVCTADTFQHKTSGQIYHGYATQNIIDGKTTVHTTQAGPVQLNLADYTITMDSQGRNRTVSILTIDSQIEYEIVADAFEKVLVDESNKGPLYIIIEIDSPGGSVGQAMRMCSALTQTRNCQTVAFIKGGRQSGAYSAAAAIALACNRIYMVGGTVIGCATMIAATEDHVVDLENVVGKNISEKMRSAWRNYLASLAEQNHRPVALARAMENKDIEVLQIRRDNKTIYIETSEKLPGDTVLRVRNNKGSLLTLPAGEAVECGMADKVVANLQEVLADLNASDAKIERPANLVAAKEDLDRATRKFNQLKNALDTKIKTFKAKNDGRGMTVSEAKKGLKGIMQEIKYLIKLRQSYADMPYEEEGLQNLLNTIQAEYDSI